MPTGTEDVAQTAFQDTSSRATEVREAQPSATLSEFFVGIRNQHVDDNSIQPNYVGVIKTIESLITDHLLQTADYLLQKGYATDGHIYGGFVLMRSGVGHKSALTYRPLIIHVSPADEGPWANTGLFEVFCDSSHGSAPNGHSYGGFVLMNSGGGALKNSSGPPPWPTAGLCRCACS